MLQHLILLIEVLFMCLIFMCLEEIRIWYLWNMQSDTRSCSSLVAEAIAQTSNYLAQSFDNLIFLLILCNLFHSNAVDLKKCDKILVFLILLLELALLSVGAHTKVGLQSQLF